MKYLMLCLCLSLLVTSAATARPKLTLTPTANHENITITEGPTFQISPADLPGGYPNKVEILRLQMQGLSSEEIGAILSVGTTAALPHMTQQSLPGPNTNCALDYNNNILVGVTFAEQEMWSNPPSQPNDWVYASAYCVGSNWNKQNCKYKPNTNSVCTNLVMDYCFADYDTTQRNTSAKLGMFVGYGDGDMYYSTGYANDWNYSKQYLGYGSTESENCWSHTVSVCCNSSDECPNVEFRYYLDSLMDEALPGSTPASKSSIASGTTTISFKASCDH